jgi:hypothetical protein
VTLKIILKLIEKYGTPLHLVVRPPLSDYSHNNEEEEDGDLEDYNNADDVKDWIKIVDDEEDCVKQRQINTSNMRTLELSFMELGQRPPFICIRKRKYIRPIQQQLKNKNYLLIPVYNGNTFYLCATSEMEQKVSEHMVSMGAYILKS